MLNTNNSKNHRSKNAVTNLLEPGFSVFLEAIAAVNRFAFSWFEGDFAFFSALRASCFMHLSGSATE